VIGGTQVAQALLRLAVLIAVAAAVNALDELIGAYYGSRLTARLRHRLLDRALALGVSGQQRFPPGDLLSRLTINAGAPASFLPLVISAATTMLVCVGGVIGLALIDLRLVIALLLGVPPAVVLIRLFVAKAGGSFVRYQELLAAVVTRLLDTLRGVRTIRASGTTQQEIDRIVEPLPELHKVGRQVWTFQGQVSWRLGLLVPMLQLLVLAVAGFALTAGDITAGQLVAAISYVSLALGSVGLVDALISLLGIQVGAGRVGEVLETGLAVRPPSCPAPIPPGAGQLELRDVSVRLGERAVLDHLDLSVPAATSVAVVGRSGTGKSVLVSLVGRLLDPDDGSVLLEGVPVTRLELSALRRIVTYAFERPALLGATVHDMIAYSRPDATRADVAAAASAAQADRFIRLLPEGYDTPLNRAPMSGGELQRLGLARSILTRARVVVLDDATSSLDTATEVKVAAALQRVLAGRTSLVVAHRAATAARADLVAWLDAGRLRALAPHDVLWSDQDYRAVFAVAEPDASGNGLIPAPASAAGAQA
jgi:ATP-binding cassette subfamily B protein